MTSLPRQCFNTLVLAMLLLSVSCTGNHHISQHKLLDSIKQGSPPIIVDVRSHSEFASGHVPGAQHVPFYAIWDRYSELITQPDDLIVLYCEHGPRAGIARFALWTLGHQNTLYLDGHMSGWKERGLPLIQDTEKPHR